MLVSLPPEDLDPLIFAALWNLPPAFDGDRLHSILAGAARVLAYRDRELGRILLEPALIERGWMFSGSGIVPQLHDRLRRANRS